MKKHFLLVLMIAVSLVLGTAAMAADSNLSTIQPVMQKMPDAMKELQVKAAAKDYFATAQAFMEIAGLFKSLDKVIPDNGAKVKWDQIHGAMINAAFAGIGACGAKDDKAIKKAIQELAKYKEEGHKLFIKQ
jgi:hypothetical protein